MKRKSICLLLLTLFIFTCSGCGRKDRSVELPENTVEEIQAPVEESVQDENQTLAENEDKNTDEVDDLETVSLLNVDVTTVSRSVSDEESGRYRIVAVDYTKVSLDEEDSKIYPELAKGLIDINVGIDNENDAELEQLKENYLEYEMDGDNENYPTYESSTKSQVLRADNHILSLLSNYYSYAGGVHGYYMVYGEAYDVASGQKLTLADVVTDENAFIKRIQEKLEEKYSPSTFLIGLDSYFKEIKLSEDKLMWSIDYSGVTVYFEPYEIASFAEGLLTVRFPFDEDDNLIKDYYKIVPDNYVTPVTTWTNAYADLDEDGKEEEIQLVGTAPEEDWGATEWVWRIGEKEISDAIESYENDSYLIKKDGKFYAYMFNRVENDYQILSIVDIATGKELGGEYGMGNYGLNIKDYGYDEDVYWNTVSAFVNPESFVLATRMDVLGTYSGVKTYSVGNDGLPVSEEEFFFVEYMGFMIKPVRDIPCKIIDKDGNVLEENATIPKDTLLRIIRTNGENIADLQATDYKIEDNDWGSEEYPYWMTEEPLDLNRGTFYRIEYEIKDYERILDGESVFDIFKGMMFAG